MTIENFINETAKSVGGLKLLSPQNTKELVGLLVGSGKKVLGIDGIFVNTEGTRPSMADSLLAYKLYDAGLSPPEIEKKINSFVDERAAQKDLLFEVVF
jgi:hypothetical protein